ncbi:hypothetical protein P691DRAFT_790527 [Macrolepiota fuliginosa MF-IS2]|uniref:Uncharacterized protein n=1 Tax=Macrolepiota fuliginosa MF-IS2 TaxID=1400762 RepID=A0A9P5XFI2_9AGAR|nr:hypothetical protein P691DRAFT_790527 [Macrolepiota fuliginosa MF-IS2]
MSDAHPIETGQYFITVGEEHLIVDARGQVILIRDTEGVELSRRLWMLNQDGYGYTIQNVFNKKFASVDDPHPEAVVYDGDLKYRWDIRGNGNGVYRVLVPDQNLYWTAATVWGVRRVSGQYIATKLGVGD